MNAQPEGGVRTLLIDNFDSYTFNLFQHLAEVNGCPPYVIRNDQLTWEALLLVLPHCHNVVISPGPGVPYNPADFGLCARLLREAKQLPILGVCLGHQGLGHVSGAEVVRAPRVAHGVVSQVQHTGDLLFRDVPSSFKAVRYHSWVVSDEGLPDDLQCIARSVDDGLVMALRHRSWPLWGVQFHPESICTEHGKRILQNFRDLSLVHWAQNAHVVSPDRPPLSPRSSLVPPGRPVAEAFAYRLRWTRLTGQQSQVSSEEAFRKLFAGSDKFFWLDSSRTDSKASRYSYMGSCDGPHALYVSYSLAHKRVATWKRRQGLVKRTTRALDPQHSFFDVIERALGKRRCRIEKDLPFDFVGGFVGYFGYEMKHECGAFPDSPSTAQAGSPDAAFMFADRVVAFDHAEQAVYLLCLCKQSLHDHHHHHHHHHHHQQQQQQQKQQQEEEEEERAATEWFAHVEQTLIAAPSPSSSSSSSCGPLVADSPPLAFTLERPYEQYIDDIRACLEEIGSGESYELCLTNKITTASQPDPLSLYVRLRKANSAPFASFLRLEEDLHILSSSPEKFLSLDNSGVVECKPIKGTAPRGATPEEDEALKMHLQTSPKDFSENLMIVDLIRNDLGRVCEIGSVHVPHLMQVESYATVHQLVTTVRGQLRPGLSAVDCVRHSFPPGSMTGAPKLRSMRILNQLEKAPRGVYSGVLGYLSAAGSASFNVVIRTAVVGPRGVSIGCGGAVVADSDVEGEFDEMLLKAHRLVTTICDALGWPGPLGVTGVPADKLRGTPTPITTTTAAVSTTTGSSPPGLSTPTLSFPPPAQQAADDGEGKEEEEGTITGGEAFLKSLSHRGMDLGLGRIRSFLASLGDPQNQVRTIHVTGTNGKGSVCAFLTAIWCHVGRANQRAEEKGGGGGRKEEAAGGGGPQHLKVGRFTSPHLVDWRESITVDERMISVPHFDAVLRTIHAHMRLTRIPLTQFEVLTAAAFVYFREEGVDLAVIEVGLGGENDATNVIDQPLASVITSISLDHVEILGDSVEAIAREKAGIIKRGRPAIVSALIPQSALAVIAEVARARDAPLHLIAPATSWTQHHQHHHHQQEEEEAADDRTHGTPRSPFADGADGQGRAALFTESGRVCRYRLRLNGEHQLLNSALAIACVRRICEEQRTAVPARPDHRWQAAVGAGADEEIVGRGVGRVEWPGRVQWVHLRNRRILVDGSHNAEGGAQLRRFVTDHLQQLLDAGEEATQQRAPVRVQWVVGMLGHKDHTAYLRSILPHPPPPPAALLSSSVEPVVEEAVSFVEVRPNVDWLKPFPPSRLQEIALELARKQEVGLSGCQVVPSVEDVLRQLDHQEAAGEPVPQHLVVVCGSLHLCGQVLAACDPFDLLETLRWEGRVGEGGTFVLLDHHLQRLRRACLHFGFCPDSAAVDLLVDQVRDRLDAAASEWAHDTSALARRVRVLVGPHGRVEVQSVEMIDAAPLVTDLSFRRVAQTKSASAAAAPSSPVALLPRTVRVRIAQGPVLRDNPFLRWKTTHRQVYATALNDVRTAEAQQGASEAAEDVILFNQFGQVTESTIANIAIVRSKAHQDGAFPEEEVVTPPVECGLLAGTMRRALLEAGWMIESPVTLADLKSAREILLFNSVRGIYRAHLLPSRP